MKDIFKKIKKWGHKDGVAFHYTTGDALVGIIGSGVIELSEATPMQRAADVVWFTTSQEPDPTMRLPDGAARREHLDLMHKTVGMGRIAVKDRGLLKLREFVTLTGLPYEFTLNGYASSGLELGADPNAWRVSPVPVPAEKWLSVEILEDGHWVPIGDTNHSDLEPLSMLLPAHVKGHAGPYGRSENMTFADEEGLVASAMGYQKIGRRLARQGHFPAALMLERAAFEIMLGPRRELNPMNVRSLVTIGELHGMCRQFPEAIATLESVILECDRLLGPGNLDAPHAMRWLAHCYACCHEYGRAKDLYLSAARRREVRFGRADTVVVDCRVAAAFCCRRLGLVAEQDGILAELRRVDPAMVDLVFPKPLATASGGDGRAAEAPAGGGTAEEVGGKVEKRPNALTP